MPGQRELVLKQEVLIPELHVKQGGVFATSLQVAEVFGKRHDNVLKKIETLDCSDEFNLLNFKEISYRDERNREQKLFDMTKDGFIFLVQGFTGKKAAIFKEAYIKRFNDMEKALLTAQTNRMNLLWVQSREEGKLCRLELTDSLKEFVEYATAQGSRSAEKYYMNVTRMTYKCLEFISGKGSVPKNFRDLLNLGQISALKTAELVCEEAMRRGMDEGMHYKDIYQYAKQKVDEHAATLMPMLRSREARGMTRCT